MIKTWCWISQVTFCLVLLMQLMACREATPLHRESEQLPNIVFIMADDLGYGDLGCFGQQHIQTPQIDQLAREGTLYTQFYSGSPVCAPARSVLMTGYHTGHTTVRGNFGKGGVVGLGGGKGRIPLKSDDITVAEVLQGAGYVTAITGKWGLGEPKTSGLPNDQGFDLWFGHLNQNRAHTHYTDYLWMNGEEFHLLGNKEQQKRVYSHDLFTQFALDFIRTRDQAKPFFLYIPYLIPHDDYEIPAINPLYLNQQWTEEEKIYASMVTHLDQDVGRIKKLLNDMGIRENTLLFFTSDNGAAQRWDGRFDSSGRLRGRKRDVYEGGIRAPMIVSMPGSVPTGRTDNTPWYMADILPTLAAFAGTREIPKTDGISLASNILKAKAIDGDRTFYWEFIEHGGKQAVRKGKWKAVRLDVHEKGFHQDLEIYDLENDPSEKNNLAPHEPKMVKQMIDIMAAEHEYSEHFPFDLEVQ